MAIWGCGPGEGSGRVGSCSGGTLLRQAGRLTLILGNVINRMVQGTRAELSPPPSRLSLAVGMLAAHCAQARGASKVPLSLALTAARRSAASLPLEAAGASVPGPHTHAAGTSSGSAPDKGLTVPPHNPPPPWPCYPCRWC